MRSDIVWLLDQPIGNSSHPTEDAKNKLNCIVLEALEISKTITVLLENSFEISGKIARKNQFSNIYQLY